jgi:hypothetical protein
MESLKADKKVIITHRWDNRYISFFYNSRDKESGLKWDHPCCT